MNEHSQVRRESLCRHLTITCHTLEHSKRFFKKSKMNAITLVLLFCNFFNVVNGHWGPSASFDCEMRKLAYEYGKKLIPRQGSFSSLYVTFFSFSRSSTIHTSNKKITGTTHWILTIRTARPFHFPWKSLQSEKQTA